VAEAHQDGPGHSRERVVAGGVAGRCGQRLGGGQASAQAIVPAVRQPGGDLVGQRQQRCDH
jgi:hypothetical protein